MYEAPYIEALAYDLFSASEYTLEEIITPHPYELGQMFSDHLLSEDVGLETDETTLTHIALKIQNKVRNYIDKNCVIYPDDVTFAKAIFPTDKPEGGSSMTTTSTEAASVTKTRVGDTITLSATNASHCPYTRPMDKALRFTFEEGGKHYVVTGDYLNYVADLAYMCAYDTILEDTPIDEDVDDDLVYNEMEVVFYEVVFVDLENEGVPNLASGSLAEQMEFTYYEAGGMPSTYKHWLGKKAHTLAVSGEDKSHLRRATTTLPYWYMPLLRSCYDEHNYLKVVRDLRDTINKIVSLSRKQEGV